MTLFIEPASPVQSVPDSPEVVLPASAFVQPHEVIGVVSNLRPLYMIRNRLEERGLWETFANILVSVPDKFLTILSTETPNMVDVTNPDVIALVRLAGGDPTEILA